MTYRAPLSHEELFRMLAIANKEKEASAMRIKELQEELGGNRRPKPTFDIMSPDEEEEPQVDPSALYTLSNVYPDEPEKTPKKLAWWRQHATIHEVIIALWAVGVILAVCLSAMLAVI